MIQTLLCTDYLECLLKKYSATFDIHRDYYINGRIFPAYGYFYSHIEKYVLVREANMWSSDSNEHILFIETPEITIQLLDELKSVIINYMEPVLVRKNEKLPPENHMYSYLTLSIICDKAPEKDVRRAIRKLKFEKGYKWNMLGFCQAHIICAIMEDKTVLSNYAGRKSKQLYKELFKQI